MKTLKEWLGFCNHNWVIYSRCNEHRVSDNGITGFIITSRCSKCGKMKNHKI